jgi:hypothetical protein
VGLHEIKAFKNMEPSCFFLVEIVLFIKTFYYIGFSNTSAYMLLIVYIKPYLKTAYYFLVYKYGFVRYNSCCGTTEGETSVH